MATKVDTISKDQVTKSLMAAIQTATTPFPRAQRTLIHSAFTTFSEETGIDLDLSFLLEDRRVGSNLSGRPSETYIAYWPVMQKIIKGPLADISKEIGCSTQVLYKHRNSAYKEGNHVFYKQNGRTREFIEIRQITDEHMEEEIVEIIETSRKQLAERTKRKYNEDGSY